MTKPHPRTDDAPRQRKTMTETAGMTLDADLEFLNVAEVGKILHVTRVSVYRLIAKGTIPVYRACRNVLFKKKDVVAYMEQHRRDPVDYGRPQG